MRAGLQAPLPAARHWGVIPPATNMIIYGAITDTSTGGLFIAGIIPGLGQFVGRYRAGEGLVIRPVQAHEFDR